MYNPCPLQTSKLNFFLHLITCSSTLRVLPLTLDSPYFFRCVHGAPVYVNSAHVVINDGRKHSVTGSPVCAHVGGSASWSLCVAIGTMRLFYCFRKGVQRLSAVLEYRRRHVQAAAAWQRKDYRIEPYEVVARSKTNEADI